MRGEVVVAVVVEVVGVAWVAGCEDDRPVVRAQPEERLKAPGVTVAELADDPGRYDGQTVRIEGEVDARPGERVLLVRGEGLLWAPSIAVVAPGAAESESEGLVAIRGRAYARLTAERRRALEHELGPAQVSLIGDGPYVVARSIEDRP